MQETPPTLRRLKLYLNNKSEEHDAGSRDKKQHGFKLRWASTENLSEDPTAGRQFGSATELLNAVQPYATVRSVAVTLDTDENCIVFERI